MATVKNRYQVKYKSRVHDRRNNFDHIQPSTVNDDLRTMYPDRISFYNVPPTQEITLDQFETFAIDRLKILIEINNLQSQGTNYGDLVKLMTERVKLLMPLHAPGTIEDELLLEERRKDHYSHYILRLAFCRTDELRRKFVNAETFLFKLRFLQLIKSERDSFISKLNINLNQVSDSEKESLKKKLVATHYLDVIYGIKQGTFGSAADTIQNRTPNEDEIWDMLKKEKLSKLNWEEVSDLVAQRKVLLHQGSAYVPEFLQLNLFANKFSSFLEQQLIITLRLLPGLDEDERLVPILDNLSRGYVSNQFQGFHESDGSDSDVNALNVQQFEKYFPACARRLMEGLKEKHHLKYEGRQQFTLFLKGIGLGPTEALKFWQMMFTNGPGAMTVDNFNKNYKYNFRHSYGLEGARINYKPYSCSQILNKPKPSKFEYHGCPYRDLPDDQLSGLLRRMGLKDEGSIHKVMDMRESREYQTACTRVFELLNSDVINANVTKGHNIMESTITHPNDYFNRGVLYEKRLTGDSK